MHLLRITGHQRIVAQKTANLTSNLTSALICKGQNVEKKSSKTILFSAPSFFHSLWRWDGFCGVGRGDIKILTGTEGKVIINFSLDISLSSLLIFIGILGNMITWAMNAETVPTLIRDEIQWLVIGLALFFLYREYVRYSMKLFIRRTFKHLQYLKTQKNPLPICVPSVFICGSFLLNRYTFPISSHFSGKSRSFIDKFLRWQTGIIWFTISL